jgi:hypothetical protein
MIGRSDIEQAILDEESMLAQVVRLLESGVGLAAWPAAMRAALGLALDDPTMSRAEGWKAVALRRHLFGPAGDIPSQIAAPREPSVIDRKRAERLRSGLPALVRYRGADYLLRAEEESGQG